VQHSYKPDMYTAQVSCQCRLGSKVGSQAWNYWNCGCDVAFNVCVSCHPPAVACRPSARGPPEEVRARLAHVTALGAAQLFLGDVHGGAKAFEHLWRCLCYEVR
jgi:hypothetical protein